MAVNLGVLFDGFSKIFAVDYDKTKVHIFGFSARE